MSTIVPNMNTNWPSEPDRPVSARGLSNILIELAKAEGIGSDIQISSRCTVDDIKRAYMQHTHDKLTSNINAMEQ